MGVLIYDLLCGGRNLGRSQTLGPATVREIVPGLRDDSLTGGYGDYVAVEADNVALVPDEVDLSQASIVSCTIGTILNRFRDVLMSILCKSFNRSKQVKWTNSARIHRHALNGNVRIPYHLFDAHLVQYVLQ